MSKLAYVRYENDNGRRCFSVGNSVANQMLADFTAVDHNTSQYHVQDVVGMPRAAVIPGNPYVEMPSDIVLHWEKISELVICDSW